MQLIAVGRLRAGPERTLFDRYNMRLRPALAVKEVAEGRGNPAEIKRREGAALIAALPEPAWAVALDLAGEAADSERLSVLLKRWSERAGTTAFLIGGAEGLDAAVLSRADARLSLGPMTWPHLLVRIMLAEQLYRAQAIAAGHPYHRAGRP